MNNKNKVFGKDSLLLDGDPDSKDWDIIKPDSENWTVDFWHHTYRHVSLVRIGNEYQMYVNGIPTLLDNPEKYINKYWYNYRTGEVIYVDKYEKNKFYVNSNCGNNIKSPWEVLPFFEEIPELKAKFYW